MSSSQRTSENIAPVRGAVNPSPALAPGFTVSGPECIVLTIHKQHGNLTMTMKIAAATLAALLMTTAAQAHANGHRYRAQPAQSQASPWGWWNGDASWAPRGSPGSGLSDACRQAAREGGPCGCWAETYFYGRTDHVLNGWNPWRADEWAHHLPHVAAAACTAAVYPGRHVVPVVAVDYARKKVTVADSWGTHEASMVGLVFVQP